MPKALQKRGRRMKRKHEHDPDDPVVDGTSKRQKSADPEDNQQQDFTPLQVHDEDISAAYLPTERAFFGMLDEQEQEFFKSADAVLERNDFENPDDKTRWLESVWREADGKELKIAQSQSCSRSMERLITISTAPQLKNLFQKFSGNFIHLMAHRFASHCCETLFTHAAPHVSEELRAGAPNDQTQKGDQDVNDVYVSMENLFLHTLAELEGNVGFLLTDRYASHALRILLLVLAGKQTSTESLKGLLQSKRKEGVTVSGGPKPRLNPDVQDRPVPKSFAAALEKLISDSMVGLDTDKLRALATHTNANPTLQLLLSLELTQFGKQRAKDERSIIKTLLPDEPFTADCGSAAFLGGMVYDPVGSHLVEKIIECAPAKLFKALYNSMFKERLASYARNETGTYVDCRIIERLGHDDLMEAHEVLCPVIPTLLEKNWTSLTRTLIERCTVRDIDTQAIAVQIEQTYQGSNGFDVAKMLKLNARQETDSNQPPQINGNASTSNADSASYLARPTEPTKVHFNILAQAMLIVPGSLSALILDSLINLEPSLLLNMANDHIVTRTLQQALITKNASMIERRKLIQQFYGSMGAMALDKSASHVVDCIWEGTHGLAFIRERIAEELAENEAQLRDSPYGRAVWKNWKMDMYKRRRSEWVRQSKIKASNDGFQDFDELDQTKDKKPMEHKTPLQLARERHAHNKAKREQGGPSAGSRSSTRSAAGASRPAAATASG